MTKDQKVSSSIIILDYKMGNLGSIINMYKYLGYNVIATNEENKIKEADKIILAGVGSFDHAMQNLSYLNLISILKEKVLTDEIPILGIGAYALHMIKYYREKYNYQEQDFPSALNSCQYELALPMGMHINISDVQYIYECLSCFKN